jgi:large subunit ribosomal protein L23
VGLKLVSPYDVVLHPVFKEKTLNLRDHENKLEFMVHRSATKPEIKRAIEKMLEVKVDKVNVRVTRNGKRAVVKFAKGYTASEISIRLGMQ